MWRAKRSRAARQRGATAVEFALVLPVFVAVLFGAIDGGRLVVSQCMLNYAVIAGARLASVSSTAATTNPLLTVQTAVVAAAPLLNLSTSAVHYQIGTGTADSGLSSLATGNTIRVYASYSYRPLVLSTLGAKTLNASGQIVVQ
jgi:Flp pilus assembly protein TadG